MLLGVFIKDPQDQLDYDIDFGPWLPDGDSVQTGDAVATEGLTVDSIQIDSPIIKVWLSGGENGDSHTVTVTATTDGGRIKEVSFKLRIREC